MIQNLVGRQWFLVPPYMPSVFWRTLPNNQWRCQQFHKTHGWHDLSQGLRVPDILYGFQIQKKHKCTNKDWNLQSCYLSKQCCIGGFLLCTCWGSQETAVLVQMRHLGTPFAFFHPAGPGGVCGVWDLLTVPILSRRNLALFISSDTNHLGKFSEPLSPHWQNNNT